MSLTYNSFTTQLANFLVLDVANSNYVTALPQIIDDSEQRCYRDLQLLNTVIRDSTAALVSGSRNFNLPTTTGIFLVVEEFNVITPAGTSNPELGKRNQLTRVSKEVLDALYPDSTGSGVPKYMAPISQSLWVVGPWPDAAYQMEVVGTQRPAPISSGNQTTLLSLYFPDLWFAASMAIGAGYLKNYGAMVDDPKMATTWDGHYQTLLASADKEETMKKAEAEGWSSAAPSKIATPPRT